jgi:hypothetical protein
MAREERKRGPKGAPFTNNVEDLCYGSSKNAITRA